MRKGYRTLISIEYTFFASIIAAFSMFGIAALVFGFPTVPLTERQGVLVGSLATIAAFIGAAVGLQMSFARRMKLRRHHFNDRSH